VRRLRRGNDRQDPSEFQQRAAKTLRRVTANAAPTRPWPPVSHPGGRPYSYDLDGRSTSTLQSNGASLLGHGTGVKAAVGEPSDWHPCMYDASPGRLARTRREIPASSWCASPARTEATFYVTRIAGLTRTRQDLSSRATSTASTTPRFNFSGVRRRPRDASPLRDGRDAFRRV